MSRPSLREGLKALARKGLIESRTRRGTIALGRERWDVLDSDVLRWTAASPPDHAFLLSLIELRAIMEPAAARLAASRATPEQILEIERAFQGMVDSLPQDVDACHHHDLAFHRSIFAACGNSILQRFYDAISALLLTLFRASTQARESYENSLAEHWRGRHGDPPPPTRGGGEVDAAARRDGARSRTCFHTQTTCQRRQVMKTLLFAVCVTLFAATAEAQTKPLLRIHTAGPNDTNVDNTKLAVEFQDRANAAQNTVEVKVFPASQLGQTREVIEAMRLGSGAAGTTGGPAEYASFVRRLGVLGLLFLWKSYEHALAVLDGPVGKELDQDMEKAGFKTLSWAVSWGYRNVITSKKEVKQAADLKGLKIRTIPTKVFVAAINSMGANATPMNFGEIYTSLQSGVLDGYEHTAATTISFKMYEVACCMALTKHLMDPTFLVFSLAGVEEAFAGRAGGAAEGGERGREGRARDGAAA